MRSCSEWETLLERVRARDRSALARAFSLVERDPDIWPAGWGARDGRSFVVSVTGAPGAGKSTLLGALVSLMAAGDMSCCVVAFDPASPRTGGALLGDRVRMLEAASLPNVFVRSVAARDPTGAGSAALPPLLALLEQFGFDFVFLESVGGGQEATPLLSLADAVMLVVAPGLGDGIQLLKAGVLELADLVVVNKTDRPGAEDLVRELSAYFRLVAPEQPVAPSIVRTAATVPLGVEDLVEALQTLRARLEETGVLEHRRQQQLARFLEARIRARCLHLLDELFRESLSEQQATQPTVTSIYQQELAIYQKLAQCLRSYVEERTSSCSETR